MHMMKNTIELIIVFKYIEKLESKKDYIQRVGGKFLIHSIAIIIKPKNIVRTFLAEAY